MRPPYVVILYIYLAGVKGAEREDPGLQAGDESGAALPVINFDTIHSSINPSNGVLSVLREPSNLISGAERAVEPVDSLPLGRGMKQEAAPFRAG